MHFDVDYSLVPNVISKTLYGLLMLSVWLIDHETGQDGIDLIHLIEWKWNRQSAINPRPAREERVWGGGEILFPA